VAIVDDEVVGHVQLTHSTAAPEQVEIKNIAVVAAHRRRGLGRALIEAALKLAREERRRRACVATATADVASLRFYQRLGFRMRSIERDAFTATEGYPPGLEVDGIPLRDRVWLDLDLHDR